MAKHDLHVLEMVAYNLPGCTPRWEWDADRDEQRNDEFYLDEWEGSEAVAWAVWGEPGVVWC